VRARKIEKEEGKSRLERRARLYTLPYLTLAGIPKVDQSIIADPDPKEKMAILDFAWFDVIDRISPDLALALAEYLRTFLFYPGEFLGFFFFCA
jgi:hypothetical protein